MLLPAYADSWFSYSRLLPLLPARHHGYTLDQRGHGDPERPDCCYTVDDFAAGIQRATLVGHSGSCFTAWRVAMADPDRVAGLVLIGAPQSAPGHDLLRRSHRLRVSGSVARTTHAPRIHSGGFPDATPLADP